MKKRETPKGAIVTKYMEEISSSDFDNLTLAKKIFKENPGVFQTIDSVRSLIRQRRGSQGGKVFNSTVLMEKFVRDEMKPSEYMANYMQKGVVVAKPVWNLPKRFKKVLVMSDLHIPYHHMEAINVALDYGFSQGIDCIYINGDLIDFAPISRFLSDKDHRDMQYELDQVRSFLYGLSELGVPIFYKLGNHDERLQLHLARQSPELQEVDDFQIGKLLRCDELGIEIIQGRQRAKFGKLSVLHGHEFGESVFSPVNPARGLFLRAKSSVLAGHNHQTSAHHENNLNGEATACFSTGALCDLSPNYRPFAYTKWNHGAAIVHIHEKGMFHVDNFRIIDGQVL